MAKIGLEYAKVAKLTENGETVTYTDGMSFGKAVKMSANINTNKANYLPLKVQSSDIVPSMV